MQCTAAVSMPLRVTLMGVINSDITAINNKMQ